MIRAQENTSCEKILRALGLYRGDKKTGDIMEADRDILRPDRHRASVAVSPDT